MRIAWFFLVLAIGGIYFFAVGFEEQVPLDKVVPNELGSASAPVQVSTPSEFDDKTQQKISHIVSRNHYLQPAFDDVYQQAQSRNSIQNYLKTLDAYSHMTSSAEIDFQSTRAQKMRVGIGVDYLFEGDTVLAFPVFGGELYKSGIQTAVRLRTINEQTLDVGNFESYKFLAELEKDETVGLALSSALDAEVQKVEVKVKTYDNTAVRYYLHNSTLVLEVRQFRSGYTGLVRQAIREGKNANLLVVDLRFSPGGDIYAMTDWLSLLLPENELVSVLRTKRYTTPTELRTLSGQMDFDKPIIVLISRYTASSAEIFARVLSASLGQQVQLVGEATKGKCLAQKSYTVSDQFSLVLSTHEVLMSNGTSCHGAKLQPDIQFPDIEFKSIDEITSELQ